MSDGAFLQLEIGANINKITSASTINICKNYFGGLIGGRDRAKSFREYKAASGASFLGMRLCCPVCGGSKIMGRRNGTHFKAIINPHMTWRCL